MAWEGGGVISASRAVPVPGSCFSSLHPAGVRGGWVTAEL